ncbi:MAG: c-type cytochrome, partial [Cyclobacteriaceae bacterium]
MLKTIGNAFLKKAFIMVGILSLMTSSTIAQEAVDTTAQEATTAETEEPANDNGLPSSEEAIAEGRTLYQNNCTQCHEIHTGSVGPALANVNERRSTEWLINFIRNSQKVIQSGDDYAVQLYNEYNQTVMPPHDFSDQEILNILAWIQQESELPAEEEAADAEDTTEGVGAAPASPYVNIILIGILVVLVLILVVLALIISVLTKYLSQRDDIPEEDKKEIKVPKADIKKTLTSKPVLFLAVFIFAAIAGKVVIDSLYTVGVYTGYAPDQPVWFSHKIHAGQYEIECNYCHTSVYESQSANIPSVNICMNCHNPDKGGIVEGTVTGTTQLNKVIEAYQNNVPIEWVRVHNLPDLAYFNHAQHTNVAG